MKTIYIILIAILITIVIKSVNSSEDFVNDRSYAAQRSLNDPSRLLQVLESKENRKVFADTIGQDCLNNPLLNLRKISKRQLRLMLQMGADPRVALSDFQEYQAWSDRIRSYSNDIAALETENQMRPRPRIAENLAMQIENRQYSISVLEDLKEMYKIIINQYLINRIRASTDRAQQRMYQPLDRSGLLRVAEFLNSVASDSINGVEFYKLLEQLVLVENMKPSKFTLSQQRSHPGVMDFLKEYWKARKEGAMDVLTESVPKDLAKMASEYL